MTFAATGTVIRSCNKTGYSHKMLYRIPPNSNRSCANTHALHSLMWLSSLHSCQMQLSHPARSLS